ncbi:Hypothetical Protein FCC1311_070722 [Hondaea fermentalgiana]|uniref:Uncharacterized protein n=1 Tax=Hondaea fermentalgiana TaxID=2315210 RepID=A0A2R5GIY4_9STRA|nr:Hypothetical Protein FCC1311_070722 [Hondaea fermentalgiana]|eukprot:GBG30852.1 Hypothetical Protein FCC1311_070722 [Hondaea fermentalgiana]
MLSAVPNEEEPKTAAAGGAGNREEAARKGAAPARSKAEMLAAAERAEESKEEDRRATAIQENAQELNGAFLHVGTEDLVDQDDAEAARSKQTFRSGRRSSSSSSRSSISSSFRSRRGSRMERIRSLSVKSRTPIQDQLLVYVVLPAEVHRLTSITAPLSVFARRCEVHTVSAQDCIRNTANRVDTVMQPEFTFATAPRNADIVVVLGSLRSPVRRWIREFNTDPVIVKIKGAYMTRYRDNFRTKTKVHMNARTELDASLDLLDIIYNEAAGNSSFTTAAASPPSTALTSPNTSLSQPPLPDLGPRSPSDHDNDNTSIPSTPTSVGGSIGDLAERYTAIVTNSTSSSSSITVTVNNNNNKANEEAHDISDVPRLLSCSSSDNLDRSEHEENPQPIGLLNASPPPLSRHLEHQHRNHARLSSSRSTDNSDAVPETVFEQSTVPSPPLHKRVDSGRETVFSDVISEVSSHDGPPGNDIAEELGFYRHFFGSDPERTRLGPRDKFNLWTLRMRAIVRERIIGVILYDGVDELGVSAVLDTWGAVSGVRLVLLGVTRLEKADPAEPGPIVDTPVITSANGLRFLDVRPLSSFARSVHSVLSLHACLLPPAGKGVRAPTEQFVRKRLTRIAGVENIRCEVWDQTLLLPTEAYTHQMDSIRENYSVSAARSVARKLAIGSKK